MGSNFVGQMVVVLTGIIGVAIIAVLVSKNANTSGVIGSFFNGFSQSIGAATAPVTGGSQRSFSGGGTGIGLSLPSIQF
jgi:hypothetical protein